MRPGQPRTLDDDLIPEADELVADVAFGTQHLQPAIALTNAQRDGVVVDADALEFGVGPANPTQLHEARMASHPGPSPRSPTRRFDRWLVDPHEDGRRCAADQGSR